MANFDDLSSLRFLSVQLSWSYLVGSDKLQDVWFRKRNGLWECKVPPYLILGSDKEKHEGIDQYMELEQEGDIIRFLQSRSWVKV